MATRNTSRAGLGARALALGIDLAFIGFLVAGIGLWLTAASSGKLRLSNTIIDAVMCAPIEAVPAGLRLPEDFKVASVRRCTRSLLGVEHDWSLTLVEAAESVADRRQIVVPLDRAGRVADPFYLDGLTLLVFLAYLFLFEWRFGASVGKRTLGLRVQTATGAPLDLSAVGKRSLMRMVAFLAMLVSAICLGLDGDPLRITAFDPPVKARYSFDLWPWSNAGNIDFRGLDNVVLIAFFLNYVVSVARGTLPWHDRWAGTEVIPHEAVGSREETPRG